jgi:DNA replication protein DnaC
VRQFRLNPAQAAVAAHVADWLPQLMHDVQHRQQQAKGRGAVRPKLSALTTNRAAACQADGSSIGVSSSSSGSTGGSSRPPVCLIHGPFGSGKSTLLVALIHLLTGLPAQQVSCKVRHEVLLQQL